MSIEVCPDDFVIQAGMPGLRRCNYENGGLVLLFCGRAQPEAHSWRTTSLKCFRIARSVRNLSVTNEDDADRQAVFSEGLDVACGRALPERSLFPDDRRKHEPQGRGKTRLVGAISPEDSTVSPTRRASLQRWFGPGHLQHH